MRRHSTSSHVYVCRELPQAYERTLLYGSYGGIHTWLYNTVDMHRMATHGRTVDSNVRGLHPLGPGIIRLAVRPVRTRETSTVSVDRT